MYLYFDTLLQISSTLNFAHSHQEFPTHLSTILGILKLRSRKLAFRIFSVPPKHNTCLSVALTLQLVEYNGVGIYSLFRIK